MTEGLSAHDEALFDAGVKAGIRMSLALINSASNIGIVKLALEMAIENPPESQADRP